MWARVRIGVVCAVLAAPAVAQDWLLVEARRLPRNCADPLACIPESRPVLRNMINMHREDRLALTHFLNRVATIRGIPEGPAAGVPARGTPGDLHDVPMAEKLAPLVGHPGVHFDSAALDADPLTAGFSDHIRTSLSQAGVRFLSKEEMEATPGRPRLSIRFQPRSESEGCIMPFSVSLSVSEETVMARNPGIKLSGTAFAATARENLANRNYLPVSALQEVLALFVKSWQAANPG